jgi:hypothetical protein
LAFDERYVSCPSSDPLGTDVAGVMNSRSAFIPFELHPMLEPVFSEHWKERARGLCCIGREELDCGSRLWRFVDVIVEDTSSNDTSETAVSCASPELVDPLERSFWIGVRIDPEV